ncbi:MAG: CRISPR-associated helicase Cas3' [Limnobaculum xujianqingii]
MRIPRNSNAIISISYIRCPAKTRKTPDGKTILGRDVYTHCLIVGNVARKLMAYYPVALRDVLFPEGSELVSAAHDVGKVSPTFVEKIFRATDSYLPNSHPALQYVNPQHEEQWKGHAGVSQVTLKALNLAPLVAEIAGQHHGFSPTVAQYTASDEIFGAQPWQEERVHLLNALKTKLQSNWPEKVTPAQARIVAGLTSVADWIGSSEYFDDPEVAWEPLIDTTLSDAGFITSKFKNDLSFQQVFGFSARQIQQQFIESISGPGVYVLEAPMGLGKTEAALYAAYQMMQTGQASGIYFALPTQLTSNKIYDRFNHFLQTVLDDSCPQRQALLLHGQAWLTQTILGEEGDLGRSWFECKKRGLLAPFAVGTLDQALMAAMHVKHGFVRAFGLAGKVVILDEVHSYDIYTGTIMQALVKLLRDMHCTVIILSATLSRARRSELLPDHELYSDAYPLITAVPTTTNIATEIPASPPQPQSIAIKFSSDSQAIEEALSRAEEGQQVLWIENTVADAQERYLDLAANAAEMGIACGLLHSRYHVQGRQMNEAKWVKLFGKEDHLTRQQQGRILVGTQVLEQSLDIDADFLITRFCPTDMLLQRFGRLWRHVTTPRPFTARCEAWIIAPELSVAIQQPQQQFGASSAVYAPYILCRSLEVWHQRQQVTLPDDIRPLIEATYCIREEQSEMNKWLYQLDEGDRQRKGRKVLRQLANLTLSQAGSTLPEEVATRYSERETIDLLLLRAIIPQPQQQTTSLTLMNGETVLIPQYSHQLSKRAWRQISAKLTEQMVRVPIDTVPEKLPRRWLIHIGLDHCLYVGDRDDDKAKLRIALVDDCGDLFGWQGTQLHPDGVLQYRDDLGFRIIKHKG